MPLGGRGHRGGALAGGKADDAALRYGAQMRRQHDIGVRGGDRGVKNRAQKRASVGHGFIGLEKDMRCRLSIRFRQKKTPAACRGGLREAMVRRQPPTSPSMMSPKRSQVSPLNFMR